MSKNTIRGLFALLAMSVFAYAVFPASSHSKLPLVAIANYGPHVSLQETIQGLKIELAQQGFAENKQVKFEVMDVNFQPSLIAQMLTKLSLSKPRVMVVMTTPVAQYAKNSIKRIPMVFSVVTDPVETGLLKISNKSTKNLTGASDKQDLSLLIDFAKQLLPHAKAVGLLYATAEPNDVALVKLLQKAAGDKHLNLVAVSVNEARDVPMRMQAFKNKVDFIYVGVSGAIQPALPAIASEANKMKIPVFNADSNAVKQHQVLASYGVDYQQVGMNTAKIVARILNGENVNEIPPIYPVGADHHGYISKKIAGKLGIILPKDLNHISVVE